MRVNRSQGELKEDTLVIGFVLNAGAEVLLYSAGFTLRTLVRFAGIWYLCSVIALFNLA
jgi:hypothetical protein